MALEKFKIDTLATIDQGRIKEAFEQAFARLVEDCKDRPELKKPRKLALTIDVAPRTEQGSLESVDVTFALKERIPNRESRTYNMTAGRGGVLWNEISPDEVRQKTLDMAGDVGPKAKVADAR